MRELFFYEEDDDGEIEYQLKSQNLKGRVRNS
jgi:hypothetical protein